MNILRYIVDYFKKIRSRFRKSSRNKGVIQRIEENKNKKLKEVDEKLQTLSTQEDNKEQVEQAIKEKTSIEIGKELPQAIKEPIFDLADIENEVNLLNQKLFEIDVQKQKIDLIPILSKSKSDEGIVRLEEIFEELNNKANIQADTNIFKDLNDKKTEVDSFFEEFRLIKIYRKREEEREREEQVKQQKVNEILSQIDQELKSETLDRAKQSIRIAERAIFGLRSSQQKTKFQKKLSNLIDVFRKKEIEVEVERQRETLERERKEAERKIKAEEKRREEERNRIEKEKIRQKEAEDKKRKAEDDKKSHLQKILTKKSNWIEFKKVLDDNGIRTLYHFTDKANLEYIKKHGGLFSWRQLRKSNIDVPYEGGGSLSKDLDRKYGLQDFVRVCFTQNHPMMYVARNEGRIPNPVILTINLEVCYFQNTKFANMNATKTGHSCGNSLTDLKNIKFNVVKQRNHFDLSDNDKPYYQAEILVKTWIPIEYITNIN